MSNEKNEKLPNNETTIEQEGGETLEYLLKQNSGEGVWVDKLEEKIPKEDVEKYLEEEKEKEEKHKKIKNIIKENSKIELKNFNIPDSVLKESCKYDEENEITVINLQVIKDFQNELYEKQKEKSEISSHKQKRGNEFDNEEEQNMSKEKGSIEKQLRDKEEKILNHWDLCSNKTSQEVLENFKKQIKEKKPLENFYSGDQNDRALWFVWNNNRKIICQGEKKSETIEKAKILIENHEKVRARPYFITHSGLGNDFNKAYDSIEVVQFDIKTADEIDNEKKRNKINEINTLYAQTINEYKEKIKKIRTEYSNNEKIMNDKLKEAKQEKIKITFELDDMMSELGYEMNREEDQPIKKSSKRNDEIIKEKLKESYPKSIIESPTNKGDNLGKTQTNKLGNKGQLPSEEIINEKEHEVSNKKRKKTVTLSMDEDLIKILKNEAKSINDLTGKNYKYTDLIRNELSHKQKAYQKLFDRLPIETFCNYLMESDISQTISSVAQNNNIPEADKMDIINFLTNYIYKIVNNIKAKESKRQLPEKQESYSQTTARKFMDDRLKAIGYRTKMSTLAFELTNGVGDSEIAEKLIKTFFFIYHYVITDKNINPNATNESMKETSTKISQIIEKIKMMEEDLKNSSALTKLGDWYELMEELDGLSQKYAQSIRNKFDINNIAPFINMVLDLNANDLRTLALTDWYRLSTFYKNEKIRLIKLLEEIENLKNYFGWYDMDETLKNEEKAGIVLKIEDLIRSEYENWTEIGGSLDRLWKDFMAQTFSKEYFNVSNNEMLNILETMPTNKEDCHEEPDDNEQKNDYDNKNQETNSEMSIEDLSDSEDSVAIRNLSF